MKEDSPDFFGGFLVGYGGGKKIAGRKRHIVVDTLGFPMAIEVHSATPA